MAWLKNVAFDCLEKPFQGEELLDAVERALQRKV